MSDDPTPTDAEDKTTAMTTDKFEFDKRVEYHEKDDDERIARGAVLVPSRVDHQGDFLRSDTIGDLRANWTERVAEGDATPGVMHAVFPREEMELVEDRQLDAPETIGGKTLPAGTWVQGWQYTDDDLWQLVSEGTLSGFSIGGTATGRIYEDGPPADVSIPEPVEAELDEADIDPDDVVVREITDGRILETSTVDAPAVPDAVHAETKALAKAAPALTENVVAARLYLEARGHDADDARRLAEYLNERKTADAGGLIHRAKSLFGGGRGGEVQATATADAAKAGRTLSAANVESAKAVHDAALDLLGRSDVDHGRMRFSDDSGDTFQIADYGRDGQESAQGDATTPAESGVESDADTDDMNEELQDTLDKLVGRVDDIESKLSDSESDDADTEETETKTDDEPADDEKVDELADAVEQLADSQAKQAELIEEMANAQGVSQQADTGKSADGNGTNKTWGENSPFAPGGDA